MERIKNNLKENRLKAKLKQKDVAKAMGFICTTKISKWERGLKYPHMKNLLKLAKIYGVQAEDLY